MEPVDSEKDKSFPPIISNSTLLDCYICSQPLRVPVSQVCISLLLLLLLLLLFIYLFCSSSFRGIHKTLVEWVSVSDLTLRHWLHTMLMFLTVVLPWPCRIMLYKKYVPYICTIYIYINSFSCCNFDKYVFPSISIVYLYLFIGVFPFCSRKTGATGAYSKLLMRIGLVFLDSGTTLPLTPRMVMVCAILLKRTCGIVLDMADVSMVSGL
jgi:hypothetical protein